jgi:hypothetical protein
MRHFSPSACLALCSGFALALTQSAALGQNVWQDYVRNVPRQYGPRDPWEVGHVLQHQAGWAGFFYNCDCEEHKRLSPYIRWEQQPTVCCPDHHGYAWQQCDEIWQRLRTGGCAQAEFKIRNCCTSLEPPVNSPCGSDRGGACPTCTAADATQEANGATGQSDPVVTDDGTSFMSKLYFAR